MIVISDERQRPFVSKGPGKALPLDTNRRPSGVDLPVRGSTRPQPVSDSNVAPELHQQTDLDGDQPQPR